MVFLVSYLDIELIGFAFELVVLGMGMFFGVRVRQREGMKLEIQVGKGDVGYYKIWFLIRNQ